MIDYVAYFYSSVELNMQKYMGRYADILKGGDLRSIGNANQVVLQVTDRQTFDELFNEIYNLDRKVAMRAADAIEKITLSAPDYRFTHKAEILRLCDKTDNIELKWHLATLVSRLDLTKKEAEHIWKTLTIWATDTGESKIVRVNSLQALHEISRSHEKLRESYDKTLQKVETEGIASVNARIRKLRKAGG